MTKSIKVTNEEYWKILELKGKFKTDSLLDIFDKLIELSKEPEIAKSSNEQESSKQPKEPDKPDRRNDIKN